MSVAVAAAAVLCVGVDALPRLHRLHPALPLVADLITLTHQLRAVHARTA